MDAGEVFGLDLLGRTKTPDGRKWVVYSDGCYTHVVDAKHWDNCCFEKSDDELIQRDRYDQWSGHDEMWADDDVAKEAARSCSVAVVHSKDGCGWMSCVD